MMSEDISPEQRLEIIDQVLERLSQPKIGQMLAYLLASGVDPFPASEEKGLEQVFSFLSKDSESSRRGIKNLYFLLYFACMERG